MAEYLSKSAISSRAAGQGWIQGGERVEGDYGSVQGVANRTPKMLSDNADLLKNIVAAGWNLQSISANHTAADMDFLIVTGPSAVIVTLPASGRVKVKKVGSGAVTVMDGAVNHVLGFGGVPADAEFVKGVDDSAFSHRQSLVEVSRKEISDDITAAINANTVVSQLTTAVGANTVEQWVRNMSAERISVDFLGEGHRLLAVGGSPAYGTSNTVYRAANRYTFPLFRVSVNLSAASSVVDLRANHISADLTMVDDQGRNWIISANGDARVGDGHRDIYNGLVSRRLRRYTGRPAADPATDSTAGQSDAGIVFVVNTNHSLPVQPQYDKPGSAGVFTYEYQLVLNLADYTWNQNHWDGTLSEYNNFRDTIAPGLKVKFGSIAAPGFFLSAQEIIDGSQ